ncbi:MAG: glucose-6-phosphate isomerase [Bacteroides sp.]|nr:glucose-6-phosphate isomerase [Bacteroides sp.]MCM1379841.1 glucose-6-phosphate isomerase [Bacteroides sp.]MCM1446127.1 glucose-6-phosphate isomerase [Prevotella sp.]
METFDINIKDAAIGGVTLDSIEALKPEADKALQTVLNGTGAGNDFLGWVNLPSSTINSDLVEEITSVANVLRAECDAVVCIGIGGSYLGAKAIIEALKNQFAPTKPEILFAGQNIGEDYLAELMDYLADKRFGIVVISKSGTTTEPAIAFRLLRNMLEQKVGREEAAKLTVAITDAKKGALRSLATDEGYATFVIDDNVGGRFSVLSPAGLLPIAIAGFNIRGLLQGAADMEQICSKPGNPAELYAMTRNALYRRGKKTEILVNYNPKLHFFAEWWKQLYGESEGKDHKGIFPAAVDNSTDLHSMGQWIQDGERTIFETVISVENQQREVIIPEDAENLDGLNFISGQHVDHVNKMAELGTRLAHIDGGVPNLRISISEINEYNLGQLIYFFEIGCGISGYMLGVNPFNQPGVEAYKKNMFALLAKPGYEAETEAIRKRIEQ